MNWLFSTFARRFGKRKPASTCRQAAQAASARRHSFRPGMEDLERRDVPSASYLQIVTTPNYEYSSSAIGNFDALSVTVNGTQYQYAGIQFGVKLANSASALPGNFTPDFYAFCVDVTKMANLTSAYQVTTTPASTLPNGAAIAYLYDTFNSPVGSPLDKTHAAALQLAIWEAEYGTNIVTQSDINFMDAPPYNGSTAAAATAETNAILSDAAAYLSAIPANPTAAATVYVGAGVQSMLAPPCSPSPSCPAITTSATPTCGPVGATTMNDAAILTGGDNPTGTITFTLTAPDGSTAATETVNVNGDNTYPTPTGVPATEVGTYYWVAAYSGDTNNVAVTSGATDEPVVIGECCPAITTSATPTCGPVGATTMNDAAILTGGDNPTGTITFTLTAPDGSTAATETVNVNGDNTYPTPTGVLATEVGTYYWVAAYSGDTNNNAVTSGPTDEPVVIGSCCPAITTCATPTCGPVGATTMNDAAILTGGDNPTGTITFTLTAPDGSTAATETVTVNGDNTYPTPTGVAATEVGTYYWVAAYSGDANNNPVTSGPTDEPVVIGSSLPGHHDLRDADVRPRGGDDHE